MAAFNIKATLNSFGSTIENGEAEVPHTHVHMIDECGEWDSVRDAFLYLTGLARDVQGWITKSSIMPVDVRTGEVLPALPAPRGRHMASPINQRSVPVVIPCPLSELTAIVPTRVPEVAIRQPSTYKEDET